MYPYYKIPPEIAAEHHMADTSPRHPDGWHLITPPKALRIARSLPPRPDGAIWDIPSAMEHIGAVGYDSTQAMASARGEKEYMMPQAGTSNPDEATPDEATPESGSQPESPEPQPTETISQDEALPTANL